nr:hypothetical protein [Gemmatimonadales bacterium]
MRLQHLSATAHPAGNRIVLQWVNLDPAGFPRVRVVRREGTHPTSPVDGIVLTPGDAPPHLEREDGAWISRLEDSGLRSDTVYYYALFPYEEPEPPRAGPDPANRTGAMATAPNGSAARMEELLPAIYRRYDADRVRDNPPGLRPEDRNKGPLRRLLEVTGSQLDQLESFARSTLDLHDIERVDGRLLPLLAQWVGWPTDHRLEIAGQRNELRQAPHIYKTIGIIPTVEATIKRVLGWESRVKEFAHNVFLSNRPERLNLWLRERDAAGVWTTPTEPLSLDFAYEGRPAAGHDAEGTLWLFYHTLRKGEWDIWYKTYRTAEGWSPSQPLTRGSRIDQHPVAVLWEDRLWVFWNSYSETERAWRIESRERSGGEWLSGRVLWDDEIERKRPSAVVDGSGGLWLFWLERVSGRWQLRYNRRV